MRLTQQIVVFLIFVSSSLLLNSCAKDDMMNEYNDVPSSEFAALSVFNGLGFGAGLDFSVDNKRINQGNELLQPGDFLSFKTIFPGNRTIEISTKANGTVLLSKAMEFKGSNFYSVFLYGRTYVKYLLTQDDFVVPKDRMASLRFANLAEGKKVDIQIKQGNTLQKLSIGNEVTKFQDFSMEVMELQVSFQGETEKSKTISITPSSQMLGTICIYEGLVVQTNQHDLLHSVIKY
ncbi:DUF4397 domain-containing protein [Sphingobacterium sp. 1.A.4]|uniref:DUF4397 domain-containing protein n=1 Tax=Sphingobacterium sp. 1.A.4 TaxID=2044603 RepID=UPI000C0C08AF|nr:DUF4397 domain-containing protein [Sphingobacterium sp. 1.A.4]